MGNELIGKQSQLDRTSSVIDDPQPRLAVGKQTLMQSSGGGWTGGVDDLLQSSDSAQLIQSLRAIRRSPTDGQVAAQVSACKGNFLGSTLPEQLYYLFTNFKKTCTGEEPNALAWFKGNLTHARGVVSTAAYNQALALAEAEAEANRKQTVSGGATIAPRAVTKAEAQKLVDGVMAGDGQIEAAVDKLTRAGFQRTEVENARRMMRRYTTLRRTPAGDVDKLHVWLDELDRLLGLALKQRTISSGRAAKVKTWVAEFRAQYPKRTAAQQQADVQRMEDGTDARVAKGQAFLDELYALRASLEKRNYFTFNGTVPAQAAMILVRKRLPELERAIAARNTAEIDSIMAREPVPWCLEKGGPRKVAEILLETHKNGVWQLELVNDLVGASPIGPITKILFSACVEGLKYASNEQSGAETVVNIAISCAAPYLDNLIGGPAVRNVFLGALRGGLESFAKDFVKVVMMPDKTVSEKIALIENAGKKAILQAFIAAITGRIKVLAQSYDEDRKRQLVESILDMAGKFGLDRQLKPELDKFLQ